MLPFKFYDFLFVSIVLTSAGAIAKMSSTETENSVFRIMPGIELIGKGDQHNAGNRNFQSSSSANIIFNQVIDYLGTHDVKLKFNNFMNSSDISRIYKQVVQTFASEDLQGKIENFHSLSFNKWGKSFKVFLKNVYHASIFFEEIKTYWANSVTSTIILQTKLCLISEARKKDKGGLGYVLLMGLMMGKTLAALGFGGVAALAAKALAASMAALLLSALVGFKKLSESGHSESGHHVQYYTADHHWRNQTISYMIEFSNLYNLFIYLICLMS